MWRSVQAAGQHVAGVPGRREQRNQMHNIPVPHSTNPPPPHIPLIALSSPPPTSHGRSRADKARAGQESGLSLLLKATARAAETGLSIAPSNSAKPDRKTGCPFSPLQQRGRNRQSAVRSGVVPVCCIDGLEIANSVLAMVPSHAWRLDRRRGGPRAQSDGSCARTGLGAVCGLVFCSHAAAARAATASLPHRNRHCASARSPAAEEEAGQSGRRRRQLERPQRWRGGDSRPAVSAPRHRSACGMEQRVKCEPRPTSAPQPDDQSRSENTFVF